MLFLLGEDMESSARLTDTWVECYRANDISSFDTIAFDGKTAQGTTVYYTAFHPTNFYHGPVMRFRFEKAEIWINMVNQDEEVILHHQDGRVERLGNALADGFTNRLLYTSQGKYPCTLHTVRPFTELMDDIFTKVPIHDFPKDLVVRDENQIYVRNLHMDLWNCFHAERLPSAMPCNAWGQKAVKIN
jgi:hypothetical protein